MYTRKSFIRTLIFNSNVIALNNTDFNMIYFYKNNYYLVVIII